MNRVKGRVNDLHDDDDNNDDDSPLILRQKSSMHSMLVAQGRGGGCKNT